MQMAISPQTEVTIKIDAAGNKTFEVNHPKYKQIITALADDPALHDMILGGRNAAGHQAGHLVLHQGN